MKNNKNTPTNNVYLLECCICTGEADDTIEKIAVFYDEQSAKNFVKLHIQGA